MTARLRRDEKCAHILHGVPLAINTGDFALGLVCTIVVRDEGLDDRTKIAVLDAIGEMSARTIEGQALDVGWVRDDVYDLTADDYLVMALGKTGYYSGISPLKIGALIGGATDRERRRWRSSARTPPSPSRSRTISSTSWVTRAPWARTS